MTWDATLSSITTLPCACDVCIRCDEYTFVALYLRIRTGNCVGARNYRAFMAFVILVTLSAAFVCTLSVLHVVTRTAHVGPEGLTDAREVT